MPQALVDSAFTFQHLFLDDSNDPVVLTTPTIEVFHFDGSGNKVTRVAAGTALNTVSGDPGRYTYTYTISSSLFSPGDVLYGTMQGTDPGTSGTLIYEVEVNVVGVVDVGTPGITTNFVS